MHNNLYGPGPGTDRMIPTFFNLEFYIQYALSGVLTRGVDDADCAMWGEFS